jgi:hypothetical protein
MKEKLNGIEKTINLWFQDLNEEYRIKLSLGCQQEFYKTVEYYTKKDVRKPLAERVAIQHVYNKLQKIANIR